MRGRKYPLEALLRQRERGVDDAVGGLAKAIAEREAAERRTRAAEEDRASHDAGVAAVRAQESQALSKGELSAADLAHAHAWQLRVDAERASLVDAEAKARGAESGARSGELRSQAHLAQAQAEAEVVEKDRQRWDQRARARTEAAEEEAAAEAFRPKR